MQIPERTRKSQLRRLMSARPLCLSRLSAMAQVKTDDHGGTNCCRQIGVDSGDADLRQQCCCSSEYGR